MAVQLGVELLLLLLLLLLHCRICALLLRLHMQEVMLQLCDCIGEAAFKACLALQYILLQCVEKHSIRGRVLLLLLLLLRLRHLDIGLCCCCRCCKLVLEHTGGAHLGATRLGHLQFITFLFSVSSFFFPIR
jgi:hypothetical protein